METPARAYTPGPTYILVGFWTSPNFDENAVFDLLHTHPITLIPSLLLVIVPSIKSHNVTDNNNNNNNMLLLL